MIKSKVEDLFKQYLETEDEIRELSRKNRERYKEIKESYLDYLKYLLSERDEWWFCAYGYGDRLDYYHFGKFQYLSFMGEKDKKIPENYGNNYECHFQFIEGFTTDLSTIAKNNLSVYIEAPAYDAVQIDHRCYIAENIKLKSWLENFNESELGNAINELPFQRAQEITENDFITKKRRIEKRVYELSYSTFKNFSCGDEIRYVNRSGIHIGKIALIRGKSAFLVDGTKINLNTPKVEKV